MFVTFKQNNKNITNVFFIAYASIFRLFYQMPLLENHFYITYY